MRVSPPCTSGFGGMLSSKKELHPPQCKGQMRSTPWYFPKMTATFIPESPLSASPCPGQVRWGMWLQSLCSWVLTRSQHQKCNTGMSARCELMCLFCHPWGRCSPFFSFPGHWDSSTASGITMEYLSRARICEMTRGGGWMDRSWPHFCWVFLPSFRQWGYQSKQICCWQDSQCRGMSFGEVSTTQLLRGHLCCSPKKQHPHHDDTHPSLNITLEPANTSELCVMPHPSARLLTLRVVFLDSVSW